MAAVLHGREIRNFSSKVEHIRRGTIFQRFSKICPKATGKFSEDNRRCCDDTQTNLNTVKETKQNNQK